MDTQGMTPGSGPLGRTSWKAWPVALGAIIAVLVIYGANQIGWWWVTLLVGVAFGFLMRSVLAFAVALLVPLIAWGGDLWLHSTNLAKTARITASLAGIGAGNGWEIILLTVVVGVVLGLVGCWLGVALRRMLTPPAAVAQIVEPPVAAVEPATTPAEDVPAEDVALADVPVDEVQEEGVRR